MFWAAYHRVPFQASEWDAFFLRTYSALFANSGGGEPGFWTNWRLRIRYTIFRKVLFEGLERGHIAHRAEFAMRHSSFEKLRHLEPGFFPYELARVEQEVVDRYYAEYMLLGGEVYLRRMFDVQRNHWLREAAAKGLPFLALVATALISVFAIFAMRRTSVHGESAAAGSLWDILSSFF